MVQMSQCGLSLAQKAPSQFGNPALGPRSAKVLGKAYVTGNAIIGGTAAILGGEWDGSEGEILSGSWSAPGVPA